MLNGVAITGESPVERNVVFKIQEIITICDFKFIAIYFGYEGTGVVVLELVVVGQRGAIGIKQTVGTLIAKHLETAIG